MKSPIVKLTSVAAVLTVAAMAILFLSRFSQPAYALDQTVEALKNIRFLHAMEHDTTGRVTNERWIEVGDDGRQIRYRHDKSSIPFVIDDGKSAARYHAETRKVTLYSHGEVQYEWIGPVGQVIENARREGLILEENASHHGRTVHKIWWPAMRSVCDVDPLTKLPVAIGDTELSYEQPPAGTFDIVMPEGYTTTDDSEETGFYASVELIQPDAQLAKIVNADDVIRLHRIAPGEYRGDLDIRIACDVDVSWGLSIATVKPGAVPGSYSCSIDKFSMAAPGGVATVGVHLTEIKTDDVSQDIEVAVVRLRVASRPGLMEDARAWSTLAFACYDAKRCEQALAAFEKMEQQDNTDQDDRAMAVIWQGHMLDLLGRREEAIARYRRVADMGLDSGVRHDQYGLAYTYTPYARERMTTPFVRIENRQQD